MLIQSIPVQKVVLLAFLAGATTLAGVWGAMSSMLIGDFLGKDNKRGEYQPVFVLKNT